MLDVAQNGCESGAATVELEIAVEPDRYRFTVRDNGKGMSRETLARAVDPFVTDGIKHPHRKVGLGLPFLVQTAEQSGGGWEIESREGEGTSVTAWFDPGNFDTPPEGDVPAMMRSLLMFDGPGEIVIRRSRRIAGRPALDYEVRKSELADALGGIGDTESLLLLGRYLRSLEEDESPEDESPCDGEDACD